jgi:uncharacterized membrane protein YhhN
MFVLFIPIAILFLAGLSAYFISTRTYKLLVKKRNKYSKQFSALVFIAAFVVIAIILLFLYLVQLDFSR